MPETTVKTQTAEVIRIACDAGHETHASLTDAIVQSLSSKRLIYPGRSDLVRTVVVHALKNWPYSGPRKGLSEHVYARIIGSGEIIGSYHC